MSDLMFRDLMQRNKELWDKWTPLHVESDFYSHQDFIDGKQTLHQTELDLVGNVEGKSLMHLQCHFGQDTLSWARLGAQVTGVDISPEAIKVAKKAASILNLDAQFVCCNVLDAVEYVEGDFDIVFSSYGTIIWLPNLKPWASMIAQKLKKGGKFVIVEFHPLWSMFDEDMTKFEVPYFNSGAPQSFEVKEGSYASPTGEVNLEEHVWSHTLSDIYSALQRAGLTIESFKEYPYSHYNLYKNGYEAASDQFMIKDLEHWIPLMYSFVAQKTS